MKKIIFTIILLLVLIGGVGYYGYQTILGGGLSDQMVEADLADVDQGTNDMIDQGLSDQTVTDFSNLGSEFAANNTPVTAADIDAFLAFLTSFGDSDTTGFNVSLADL